MSAAEKKRVDFVRLLGRCEAGTAESSTRTRYVRYLRVTLNELSGSWDGSVLASFERRLCQVEAALASASRPTSSTPCSRVGQDGPVGRKPPSESAGHSLQELQSSSGATMSADHAALRRQLGLTGAGTESSGAGRSSDRELEKERGRQDELLKEVDNMASAMKDAAAGWNDSLQASASDLGATETLVDGNLSKVDAETSTLQKSLKVAKSTSQWTFAGMVAVAVLSFAVFFLIKIIPKAS